MKLKRRRASEVPPKIRSFINGVTSTPLENIQEPLKEFVWDFDKGDFHHWVDLFNHFDLYFEKHIKPRKDLRFEDDFLNCDPPFPKENVLQILRTMRIILENCTNKHFLSCYEHLSSLLASADADVVEASLQTLATSFKKTVGKYSIRDASLSSRLFSFAQGWGCKEEGLGLTSCTLEKGCDSVTYELGSTLHFEFYRVAESSIESDVARGLQIIHLPNVNSHKESDLELLDMLVKEYGVPPNLRFSLFTRLRFARAFGSSTARQQYTCIRLYAFVVVVQASSDAEDLVSFFNTEPEFTNELVSLLSFEDLVPEKIRFLSLQSLIALSQDRSRQSTVLAAVTSGGQRGILSSLMQKAIDSVSSGTSKWSVVFAEALLSLVTVLVSSSSGCSAMREAGFIPTLLPLLKDMDPQHLHLVGTAVHVLEAFMDYSNPAAALFRDLGGLDDTINRLNVEVSVIENGLQKPSGDFDGCRTSTDVTATPSVLDDIQPLYSESLLVYHRRLLMKALLRAISLGTYAPGSTDRIYGSEESLLPQCLCIIFRRAKDFGGGVFSLAATVMSDLIHKDPTCFPVLDAAGLPSAFLDAIMDGVLCAADAVTCIPQCLDALCLNTNGLQAVEDRNALSCFVKIFTSRAYLRALTGEAAGSLSSGLDELMRHAATLRGPGVDMLIDILNTILKLGSGDEAASSSVDSASCPAPMPMESDSDVNKLSSHDEKEVPKSESSGQIDQSSDSAMVDMNSYLPECISNACRLLETILQNSDTCRLFTEKKGIEAVLQMLSLPLLPVSVSVGQSISIAFKNFSAQHSASLARAVCSFLRKHLSSTIELLESIEGTPLANLDSSKQTKILRCLSSLEGILSLSNSLLKGTSSVVSELGAGDADVLKDIGRVYRDVLWQISLSSDSKEEQKQNADVETENADGAPSSAIERERDDDAIIPVVRYMNPISLRSGSQSQWAGERNFISVIRSGEGLSRRNRHGLTRIRGGRTGRHLDVFNMDTEVTASTHESSSSLADNKKKSPDILASEILSKLSGTMRSFYTALVKGFSSPNRRRADSGSMSTVAKNIGTVLARIFLEALNFSGYSSVSGLDNLLSVKCRYLGKVVHDMAALTFDNRRRICFTAMVNNFYVSGAFKELLTTFEATSQLLWSLPHSIQLPGADLDKACDGNRLEHRLLDTLQCYCRVLEYFVNSSLLLSPTSPSQVQLLVQPVAVGLSIGLFPVPRDPEVFVRMLQSQVLDVILPVWNHPMFPHCNATFITSVLSIVTHIYSGVRDMKRSRSGVTGSTNQRVARPPDEATIATIVEMGFSRARAEEALRRVESNSVEMAMDWLCTHAEDPVQEDDELARALALSLGSSTETSKADTDKSVDVLSEEEQIKAPPVDDILGSSMKLFQSGESLAFPLTDLLATLSNRNKGEDRLKVASYLIQRLKLCSSDLSKDAIAVSSISHILALLLSEDTNAREIAAKNGIVPLAIEILKNLRGNELGKDVLATKSTSALLLIIDNLLQSRPNISLENVGEPSNDPSPDSSGEHAPVEIVLGPEVEKLASGACKESVFAFQKIFGKSTGYLSMDECLAVLEIAIDMLKQQVPAVIMQAVLQLCSRLTKTHSLALRFLECGGMASLFDLPKSCLFAGYDTLASAIIRHLLEDPQTLQTAMELEIRQTLSGGRHSGRIQTRVFLTSMAPVISRDPVIFTKAAAAVCQLESYSGRSVVVLLKEKEKERERSKATVTDGGSIANDPIRMPEIKVQDGPGKGPKSHKKIPANLAQVIDHLLEIVLQFPCLNSQENCSSHQTAMQVDEPAVNVKGKSKIDEATKKGDSDVQPERSAALGKVIFVLKLLSEILLMYVHAIGVVLRRDSEICQQRVACQLDSSGQGGVVHHVLHKLLPLSSDKSDEAGDLMKKLSEKASWFLVVLCGRSSEGRRRVINELVKALSVYSNSGSNSNQSFLLPDRKVLAFVELVYSVLSKNTSSSSLSVSGYSPDIARGMIEGGIVQCLSSLLQVIDLDHPDAPKIANLILKALESLTRAANANDQSYKSDIQNKKKSAGLLERSDDQATNASANAPQNNGSRSCEPEVNDPGVDEDNHRDLAECLESNTGVDMGRSADRDAGLEGEETQVTNPTVELAMEFTSDDMEEGDLLHDSNRISMEFHVENRADEDVGDEDDDMGGEGEEDDEDDDADDEDEDVAEDGTALMSLAGTDVDDHEDAGFGDEYNDDMIDDDEEDYHENRVIEVRWREALDGFHHLQVAQSGSGLIDVASEPFEGVNVDDLFGLRRTLGFERRRQTNRSFERSNTDSGLQHPLLLRPPQVGDASLWSSSGNASRETESLSGAAGVDVNFYMLDNPPFLHDFGPASLFGDRSGGTAPPPLTDYSVGMESSQLGGRRGPGDGRWADDGQPQAGNQASAIAQAVEEVFVSILRGSSTVDPPAGIQSQNTRQAEQQLAADEPNSDEQVEMQGDLLNGEHTEVLGNGETEPQPTNEQGNVYDQDHTNVQPLTEVAAQDSELLSNNPAPLHTTESASGPCELMRTELDSLPSSLDLENNIHLGGDIGQIDNMLGGQTQAHLENISSGVDSQLNNDVNNSEMATCDQIEHHPAVSAGPEIEMNVDEENQVLTGNILRASESNVPVDDQNVPLSGNSMDSDDVEANVDPSVPNAIDPTFLEALPEDLRAEVLASQQSQSAQPPTYTPPSVEDIDPEFLAALPPDIQAEVLAQQRAQRVAQQSEGQPVDMDNASIIATLPADLREEVLLTSSEAVLSALPSPLLAEAQMLRDRAISHYQARSIFGGSNRLSHRRNGLGFDRQSVMDRGVGVTIGHRAGAALSDALKVKEVEGEPLLDGNALRALIRLLRLAQPLGKGLLQRLLLNLCAHSLTRATLVHLLLEMVTPEAEGMAGSFSMVNPQRLYGCPSNLVYGQSQLLDGLPPLVLRRVLEILNYLATNHTAVANTLFYFEPSLLPESSQNIAETKKGKGKEKVGELVLPPNSLQKSEEARIPLILLLKLLNRPLFRRSIAHVEQVMGLLQVVVFTAASRLESLPLPEQVIDDPQIPKDKASDEVKTEGSFMETETTQQDKVENTEPSTADKKTRHNILDVLTKLPRSDLRNLSRLLGYEGLSDKVYMLAGEVLKKLASVTFLHRKFFMQELSDLAQDLSSAAVSELITLKNTRMMGLSAGSMAGAAMLRVLQALSSLPPHSVDGSDSQGINEEEEDQAMLLKLNSALESLWQELSDCISTTEAELGQSPLPPIEASMSVGDGVAGPTPSPPSLPPGTQRLLPFIESFFVLCERLQSSSSFVHQDQTNVTAQEVKECADTSSAAPIKLGGDSQRRIDNAVIFSRFADKHRRLLNAYIRQNPGLLEKSLSLMLKSPRLIDFDNKRAYFRSRIRQHHEQHLTGPLRISVRRAYVLEDSYNQLRMRSNQDLKGRLNVQFQGEEGIDAGGLTREWYQLLSRVVFDKGALLFTTVGSNATFQPNPNSVYQTEHLSYFKFVGRVVAKALFDGQLLDVYFTRSFYKHMLGVKVTYHDIEAVDPDYYKNLKWLLENDVSDILDLTFSMDADEEKLILYEKTQVTDYELKPGGRNIRVTEETKHEYVDLVADHILTNAIRPQINSFLEGFNELVPRELISIFNDKELELLISGLPEIDMDDLKTHTEYTGYTAASNVIQWFWEVVSGFSKEDMARFLQFVTGTSKVPLEGFKALQGISGPQRFQIHKAYGAPERLPSAHTCFNQLDLPEYPTKEHLRERLLLAIHEASEGFGFG